MLFRFLLLEIKKHISISIYLHTFRSSFCVLILSPQTRHDTCGSLLLARFFAVGLLLELQLGCVLSLLDCQVLFIPLTQYIKLNNLRIGPGPKVQYQNWDAKEHIRHFLKGSFSIIVRLNKDMIQQQGQGDNGKDAKHNSEGFHDFTIIKI
jgi:hypothetical protein